MNLDIYIPSYSHEERKQIFDNLKAGDTLWLVKTDRWSRSRYTAYKVTVLRRTPSGAIRLDSGELIKGELPWGLYLECNDLLKAIALIKLENNLIRNIDKLYRDQYNLVKSLTYDELSELNKIIEKVLVKENVNE